MRQSSIVATLGGRGHSCQCPACAAHGRDRSRNNLSVHERDGRLLVRCFAGCSQDSVVAALREMGLWPECVRPSWTVEQRRAWSRRRSAAENLARRVQDWQHGKAMLLEVEKRRAGDANDEEKLEIAARALYLHEALNGAALIAAYRADADAAAHVRAGRDDREHAERVAAVIAAVIAVAEYRKVAA